MDNKKVAKVFAGLCMGGQFEDAANFLNIVKDIGVNTSCCSKVQAKWETLPRGWTMDSVKKFWDSLTGDAKHKFTACKKKIETVPGITDPDAFCASLKDIMKGTTFWRKGRKPAK